MLDDESVMSDQCNTPGSKNPNSFTGATESSYLAAHSVRQRHTTKHATDKGENQQDVKQEAKENAKQNKQAVSRPGIPFVTCPVCNKGDLCPRRRSSLKDWLAGLIGLTPYRCNRCSERVYRRP